MKANHVFINCPFDEDYKKIFDALVFTVHDCQFVPRCALEVQDSGETRLSKIVALIKECRLSVHDLSRTELDNNGLPRFNMPFELGLALGCRYFGRYQKMSSLILDVERFRFQKFISDIGGQDPKAHENKAEKAIERVRNWLKSVRKDLPIPGADEIISRFNKFQDQLPDRCKAAKLNSDKLDYVDFSQMAEAWIMANSLDLST